jgi:hypothetical protein
MLMNYWMHGLVDWWIVKLWTGGPVDGENTDWWTSGWSKYGLVDQSMVKIWTGGPVDGENMDWWTSRW